MVRIRTQWFVVVVLASLVLALTGLPGVALAESHETGARPQSTGPGGSARLPPRDR